MNIYKCLKKGMSCQEIATAWNTSLDTVIPLVNKAVKAMGEESRLSVEYEQKSELLAKLLSTAWANIPDYVEPEDATLMCDSSLRDHTVRRDVEPTAAIRHIDYAIAAVTLDLEVAENNC